VIDIGAIEAFVGIGPMWPAFALAAFGALRPITLPLSTAGPAALLRDGRRRQCRRYRRHCRQLHQFAIHALLLVERRP
jgi:hypothetical protein